LTSLFFIRLGSCRSFSYAEEFEICKRHVFFNLIAESNASNVVLTLNAHPQSLIYVGSIIENSISFDVCFCSLIFFLHVRHETNQAAHYLAKYVIYNLDCI